MSRAAARWYALACCVLLRATPLVAQSVTTTGAPDPLIVRTAIAGHAPDDAVGSGGTYSVVVTSTNQKITGQIDTPMPPGVTLRVTLVAPSGATSLGAVSLDTSPRDLVTGLQVGTFSNMTITYRLEATTAAGVVPPASRSVTLKVVAGP